MRYAVGMDIGGTNTKAGVVLEGRGIIEKIEEPTESNDKYRLLNQITKIVEKFKTKYAIVGVGIGVAGLVDHRKGVLISSPHLPLKDFSLQKHLQKELGTPVFIDNDVNAAALGEHYFGAAKKARNFIYLTLGTGVGGAIFIDNKLYQGASGFAGELGHMMIDIKGPRCDCGVGVGCLEALASGAALEKITGRPGDEVTEKAEAGDKRAREALATIGKHLGVGIANIINIFDPELVIVGGKVPKAGAFLLDPAKDVIKKRTLAYRSRKVAIKTSALGDDAGVMGAAAMVFQGKI